MMARKQYTVGELQFLGTLLLAAGLLPTATANMHVAHAPKRHDFRMGFKRPFKINDEVPYWETHEDATVTDYFVRLSRNLPNHQGSIWSTISNPHREWEAHFTLHISGPGEAGSDGMAFWYTAHRGQSGPTYGNEDPFQGLGIIFHTYDENEKKSSPFVMAYLNDGHTKLHETNNLSDHMIGSCFRDVRRTTHLVHGRVTYQNRKLTFSLDTTSNGEKMIECFEKDGVDLPPNYYFGFTAASGPQPDDHDVNSFDLFELNPAPKITQQSDAASGHHMDDKMKAHYNDIQHKMDDFHHHEGEHIEADQFGGGETDAHDLHQFEMTQEHILEAINGLHSKLDLAGLHGKIPDHITGAGGAVHGDGGMELREDIRKLGRELVSIKSVVDQVAHRSPGDVSYGSGTTGGEQSLQSVLHKLDEIQHFLETAQGAHFDHASPPIGAHPPPHAGHHMSPFTLIGLVVAAQALILVFYSFYKKRSAAEKKYF